MDHIRFEFRQHINTDLPKCIRRLESALKSMKKTPFHQVLGLHFRPLVNKAASYLVSFHQAAEKKFRELREIDSSNFSKVKAIYFEMNGFTINPGLWYFEGFAYGNCGSDFELDWLADWQADTGDEPFILTGMEKLQKVYAASLKSSKENSLADCIAEELTDHLVAARFMQLVKAAHTTAQKSYPPLKRIPVFATAHDWDDALVSR